MSLVADPAQERLAATIEELSRLAHKMNNPLTSLLGRAQLLQMGAEGDERVRQAAKVIEESAGRIAAHVRELANLVREARELTACVTDDADMPGSEPR